METREVGEHIIDGEHYVLMVKAGFDGQSGRGRSGIKGKKVNDDKWFVYFNYFYLFNLFYFVY